MSFVKQQNEVSCLRSVYIPSLDKKIKSFKLEGSPGIMCGSPKKRFLTFGVYIACVDLQRKKRF